MTPFKSKTRIQIRFKDIDKLGHVNNANHISYFESARLDYFNELTSNNLKIDWENEGIILAKIEMEYKQPIFLENTVYVYTWVSHLGSKSFEMSCSIVREVNGKEEVAAKGIAIIVCFNYKTNESIMMPESWKVLMVGS
jgi:acyl-CoA thioester hydrolase